MRSATLFTVRSMETGMHANWKQMLVSPEKVIKKITPGVRIFIGTGVSEPLTLFKHLKDANGGNLVDLDIFQQISIKKVIRANLLHPMPLEHRNLWRGLTTIH